MSKTMSALIVAIAFCGSDPPLLCAGGRIGYAGPATATEIPRPTREEHPSEQVEHYGVIGFKQDFHGTLTVTPFSQDPSIREGAGHSRITFTGPKNVFTKSWAENNVEFVAYRIHKNPHTTTAEGFFPSVVGSRYSRVVRMVDGKNLIVDFEYNGGDPKKPKAARKVFGYFFIDCSAALRAMVAHPDRPETLVFRAGTTYVSKGMPNIPFLLARQKRDMRWVSSDPHTKARLKLSMEDVISRDHRGRATPGNKVPDGAFFQLDAHDHSIFLDRIDIVGPTYTVPTVQPMWRRVMFSYSRGECARTLEIRNCDTNAEKKEFAARRVTLPAGASWLAPRITGIVGGGGKRGDRGDGVIDIVAYQRFNLIRSTWIAWGIHSIKNNDGAGNWITIDGVDTDSDGMPVHEVYEAKFIKRNLFKDIKLSFHDLAVPGGRGRGVRVESDRFAWDMLTHQYWTGGTSTAAADVTLIRIDGFELYFGNNGDWRKELGDPRAYYGYLNARDALLFDRIPRTGDRVKLEKISTNTYRAWGWGIQENDTFTYKGTQYTVASRTRKAKRGSFLGSPASVNGGYAHFWIITVKGDRNLDAPRPEVTIVRSRTAYLLDGKPRIAEAAFPRDLYGHWQYNRAEVNYEFRNICFTGNYRQTVGPADNGQKYDGLWELPVKQEWVNCWAMKTDGSVRGKPADSVRSEAFNKSVLQLRNTHPESKKHDYHILVDGGRLFAQRVDNNRSPLHLRNRPQLIYGSASFGEPRLCNPVMLDNKGVDASAAGLSLTLTGGHVLDLSNTTGKFLNVYGNGALIIDRLTLQDTRGGKSVPGVLRTRAANGLEKDKFNLRIRGSNGRCNIFLQGAPVDGSVNLNGWNITDFKASPEWKGLAGKIRINGRNVK